MMLYEKIVKKVIRCRWLPTWLRFCCLSRLRTLQSSVVQANGGDLNFLSGNTDYLKNALLDLLDESKNNRLSKYDRAELLLNPDCAVELTGLEELEQYVDDLGVFCELLSKLKAGERYVVPCRFM